MGFVVVLKAKFYVAVKLELLKQNVVLVQPNVRLSFLVNTAWLLQQS